ncbi:Uncharacterised protein [Neisseria gonorrhoeae]|uniref:Uncharacterized protein n=1 Tax=Neisseria gonorrhoeae TaxID=485 RepID=A0A378VYU4_NEIGO|nr:Uncharacterised protein [Neisseria gonorrhoeae]
MAFQKFARTVFAAQLQNVIAYRRLNQNGKVASDGDGQRNRTDVDVEDGFGFGADAQPVELLHILVVRLDQIDNELQDFLGRMEVSPKIWRILSIPKPRTSKNRAA